MEEIGWQKDKTPYIVFSCRKCYNFLYSKATQKTKKCVRCGCSHVVNTIQGGVIVYGISKAVSTVQEQQNELAVKELGSAPELRASGDFKVDGIPKQIRLGIEDPEETYIQKFNQMICELSNLYTEFPYYLIEMMAENFDIPESEIKFFVKDSLLKGRLFKADNGNYTHSNRDP